MVSRRPRRFSPPSPARGSPRCRSRSSRGTPWYKSFPRRPDDLVRSSRQSVLCQPPSSQCVTPRHPDPRRRISRYAVTPTHLHGEEEILHFVQNDGTVFGRLSSLPGHRHARLKLAMADREPVSPPGLSPSPSRSEGRIFPEGRHAADAGAGEQHRWMQ